MARLQNKVAIVTGAAQGIGKGIARALGKEGAVVALWDIADHVQGIAKELRDSGSKAYAYTVNVADIGKVDQTASEISDQFGKIDILVNNAGTAIFSPFVEMTPEDRDIVFNINFNGMWNCTKAIIPGMLNRFHWMPAQLLPLLGPAPYWFVPLK